MRRPGLSDSAAQTRHVPAERLIQCQCCMCGAAFPNTTLRAPLNEQVAQGELGVINAVVRNVRGVQSRLPYLDSSGADSEAEDEGSGRGEKGPMPVSKRARKGLPAPWCSSCKRYHVCLASGVT